VTVEREIKLAVPDAFTLPDLGAVRPGTRAVDRGVRTLDATYWDTRGFALLRAGMGLRHRTGDRAGGLWTLKGPSTDDGAAVVRDELEVPGEAAGVPPELLDAVSSAANGAALQPVVRIRTLRHLFELLAGGEVAVEVADDRVSVLDAGGTVRATFREVELELRESAQQSAVDSVLAAMLAAGAAVDPTPKYLRGLRALGFSPRTAPTH
jgi:inorganic triphosphatase YgiF